MEPTVQDLYGVSSFCINKNWNLDDEYPNNAVSIAQGVDLHSLDSVESSKYVAKYWINV